MEDDEARRLIEEMRGPSTTEKLRKAGTLGGSLKFNKANKWMYFGDCAGMSKEKLFGMNGPIHPGMPHKHEMGLDSVESDTAKDLVNELMAKGLTREEARKTIKELLEEGYLVEVYDKDLRQKVLVMRE